MTRQIITVDIAPEVQSDRRLKVSQYDVGRPLGVYIVRNGEPVDCSGYTAQLYICKFDGALYERVCDINETENNLVMWETEEQESAAAGVSIAEIRIKQGDVNIGTANFTELVEESPSDMAVASHSESQSLIALIDRAEEVAETAETAISTSAASAQEAAEAAERAESAKDDATASAESAEQSASSAFASAEAAGQSAASALQSAENAGQSASAAGQSAASALQSAESAGQSASAAGQSATSAGQSASEASRSAAEAVENAASARQSATSAWESANMADLSASDAVGNALKSEGYAVGKQNGTDVPSTSPYYQKNAKYYSTEAEEAKNAAVAAKNSAEAVVPSVDAAGQEQIAAVAAKGQEVLDSIPADYSDLTEEVADLNRALNLRGGSGLTVIDQAEMLKKMTIVRKSENILNNKRYLETGGYYDWNTGNFVSSSNYNSYSWVPVEAETTYAPNYLGNITFWTADKQFISGVNSPSYFTTPANCAYMCGSTTNTPGNYTATLAEGQTKLQNYTEYYVVTKLDKDYYVIEFNDGAIAPDALQDIPPEKISFLIPGSANGNLFDPLSSTPGGYYDNTNTWVTNAAYKETAFIRVKPNTDYRIKDITPSSITFNAYSENFTFLSNMTYDTNINRITTPANCAYVRFAYSGTPTVGMFGEYKHFPLEYVACSPIYDIDQSVVRLPEQPYDLTQEMIEISGTVNIFDPQKIETCGYYNGASGWVYSSGYNSTGLIPVEYGKTYKFGGTNNTFHMTTQYDASLNVLASGQPSSGTYTISNDNCKYIRVCFTGLPSTVMVTELDDYPEEYVPYVRKYIVPGEIVDGLVAIDPTLSVAGEAADAKETGDRIAEISGRFDFLIEEPANGNMFDPSKSISGGYYDSTDTWHSDTGYYETGFIKIKPLVDYYWSGFAYQNNFNVYDDDFEFLSNVTPDAGISKVTPPANAVYLRFSYHKSSTNCMFGEYKHFPLSYIAFEPIYGIDQDIVQMPEQPYDLSKDLFKYSWTVNIFDKDDIETLGYYNKNGWQYYLSMCSSGLIPVTYGKTYKFGGNGNTFGAITQYDNALNALYSGQPTNNTYEITYETCCYIRVAFTGSPSTVMVTEIENFPSEYVAYERKYVVPTGMIEKAEIDTQAYVLNNRNKFKANPPYALEWEMNYAEGENQPTHPSVCYFQNGWNGHKFWMAYTPYPNNANIRENPCIAFSDDGYTWKEYGISNPLDIPASGYNSDCELVYNNSNSTLYCYWRQVTNNTVETYYRMQSTDGLTWTNKTQILGTYEGVSPAIVYDDGTWKMWTRDASYGMNYYESNDGITFEFVKTINLKLSGENDPPWHLDVEKTAYGYEFVGSYNHYIIHAVSADNDTYTITGKIIGNGYRGNFDSKQLYRPTILRTEDSVMIYYGANGLNGQTGHWGIGVIEAPSIARLVDMYEGSDEM